MKQLTIDWSGLEEAFEGGSMETDYYLDTETGQTLAVMYETRRELARIYDDRHDPDNAQSFDLPTILSQIGVSDWETEMLLAADLVERDFSSRFVKIPKIEGHEAYRVMEDFIFTVENERLARQLEEAIIGRGAFRRFKDVLSRNERERNRWFAFSYERTMQEIRDWLAAKEIEPLNDPD
jgi:hypothetical protein